MTLGTPNIKTTGLTGQSKASFYEFFLLQPLSVGAGPKELSNMGVSRVLAIVKRSL